MEVCFCEVPKNSSKRFASLDQFFFLCFFSLLRNFFLQHSVRDDEESWKSLSSSSLT